MSLVRILVTAILLLSSASVFSSSSSPLIETDWLANNLNNVVVLDVRTNKNSFTSKATFIKNKKTGKHVLTRVGGHIPGAKLILYKTVRGDRTIDGKNIKHMVVTGDQFETIMQKAGVNNDSHIVITTNAESGFDLTMATRMYWQVKYYGHDNVSILNGGTAQWIIDAHKISTSANLTKPGNWKASEERESIFANSIDVLNATESDTQIVDVRPLGQYLGTEKSGKAKTKGHIPTAKVFPIDLLSKRNSPVKFSSISELQKLSKALSIDDQQSLILYCNSGHMASGGWFVFHELLGNTNTKLYDGSMHQWTHEDRPVVSMIVE